MLGDTMFDEKNFNRLERELAAVLRQYQRATEAGDHPAELVEAEAICSRIRWLLDFHLELRVGMSSDDWVWLDGQEDDCRIERLGAFELRIAGRLYCSLPEGHRQWTEPFVARISHSPTDGELCNYTIWFGNRETLQNLPKVQQLIESGEVVSAPAPEREDSWAFVFAMGDRA